jgi:cytochrome c oxidase subunit II
VTVVTVTSRRLLISLGLAVGVVGAGCAGPLSTLDPAGPQAQQIADLGWLMLAMATGVTLLVVGLAAWAVWRGRRWRGNDAPPVEPIKLVIGGGIVLPLLVLPIVWILSLQSMATLAGPPEPPQLVIEVTGRQFSYAVSYPDHGIELVDEVRIPVDQPVLLRLRSEDVIHSFWVPRLGGKMDLVPGQLNEMWIEASRAGTYQGRCAEFCGIGHTGMGLVVVALDESAFAAWLTEAAGAAP